MNRGVFILELGTLQILWDTKSRVWTERAKYLCPTSLDQGLGGSQLSVSSQ